MNRSDPPRSPGPRTDDRPASADPPGYESGAPPPDPCRAQAPDGAGRLDGAVCPELRARLAVALAGITSATIDPGSVVGSPGAAPGLGSDATTGRTTGTIPEQRWATSIPTTERTDRAHARRVTAWTVLLTDLPGALVPSARHLLTALDHRGDARGSLAAALSCWQGMFGTADGTDDSFQVCTALTLLIEPDPCRRPTVLTDLRRLYAARSHGAGSGAHARDRDLAVDIALRGLGAALHRPALLAASTPDERAACVVLGESSDSLHHEAQSHVVACHCPAPEVPTDT